MTEANPMARLTLERLARTPADWVEDGKCLSSGVDMMTASKSEMERICGSCTVREQCMEGAHDGQPVRAGVRGGHWMSKTSQQP